MLKDDSFNLTLRVNPGRWHGACRAAYEEAKLLSVLSAFFVRHAKHVETPAIGVQRLALCHSPLPGGNLEDVDDVRVLPVRVEGMAVDRGPDRAVDLHFIKTQTGRKHPISNPNDCDTGTKYSLGL